MPVKPMKIPPNTEVLAQYQGSKGQHLILKSSDGNIYCSCPAWKFQKDASGNRTCKHLVDFFNANNPGFDPGPFPPHPVRRPNLTKNIPLRDRLSSLVEQLANQGR